MSSLLIENQLLPSVVYFKNLINYQNLIIEQYENYQKMSFRNRFVIYGANGLITLSVPLMGGREQKTLFHNVKIDYSDHWQQKHWRAIVSSYSKSPYFDFYAGALKKIVFANFDNLSDYNFNALKWCLEVLKMEINITFTSKYNKKYENYVDYRNVLLPKNFQSGHNYHFPKYSQVFEERFGFQPNLSIIDLLFAEGPAAKNILSQSVK